MSTTYLLVQIRNYTYILLYSYILYSLGTCFEYTKQKNNIVSEVTDCKLQ